MSCPDVSQHDDVEEHCIKPLVNDIVPDDLNEWISNGFPKPQCLDELNTNHHAGFFANCAAAVYIGVRNSFYYGFINKFPAPVAVHTPR